MAALEEEMTILLDSTVLIDVLRRRPSGVALMDRLLREGHSLATAAINVAEIYGGMKPHEADRVETLFNNMDVYETTFAIARRAGMLVNGIARKGRTHTVADMIVAATALEYGFTIATDNRKDFENTGASLLPLQ
ncbi:MAG TPA: PIN domain-containing protein [Acidobacteriaceae bacterium]|nr:PIN domain-containing protein [Acidobacteriaceae bacterium]